MIWDLSAAIRLIDRSPGLVERPRSIYSTTQSFGATDQEDQAAFLLDLPGPCLFSDCEKKTRASGFSKEPKNLLVRGTPLADWAIHQPPGRGRHCSTAAFQKLTRTPFGGENTPPPILDLAEFRE